jgi:hypothetical protein
MLSVVTVQIRYLRIWMIHIVEEIKLLPLPSNRLVMTSRIDTDGLAYPDKQIEEWSKRWNIKISKDKTQAIYFSHRIRPSESLLTLNGRNISFVNNVKYLGVIFDKKITWRPHIELIEAKAFRASITTYSLLKSKQLSTNIKALIRSVMTYACPAWKFAADTHLLKLQRLQNKVLRTIGNFPRYSPVCELHKAFNIRYIYDYITKLCRKQAKIMVMLMSAI